MDDGAIQPSPDPIAHLERIAPVTLLGRPMCLAPHLMSVHDHGRELEGGQLARNIEGGGAGLQADGRSQGAQGGAKVAYVTLSTLPVSANVTDPKPWPLPKLMTPSSNPGNRPDTALTTKSLPIRYPEPL
jgi:hypothetical protein